MYPEALVHCYQDQWTLRHRDVLMMSCASFDFHHLPKVGLHHRSTK